MIKLEQLTKREKEVLELVGLRKKNREIAQALGITEYTINKHMTQIMAKLHVHKRMQAFQKYKESEAYYA